MSGNSPAVNKTPCKKPSRDTPKEVLKAKAKEEQEFKARRRVAWHKQGQGRYKVRANVSNKHPDAGKHPRDVY
jgi:hypothetical protein